MDRQTDKMGDLRRWSDTARGIYGGLWKRGKYEEKEERERERERDYKL
jgi:hypothetical protein